MWTNHILGDVERKLQIRSSGGRRYALLYFRDGKWWRLFKSQGAKHLRQAKEDWREMIHRLQSEGTPFKLKQVFEDDALEAAKLFAALKLRRIASQSKS